MSGLYSLNAGNFNRYNQSWTPAFQGSGNYSESSPLSVFNDSGFLSGFDQLNGYSSGFGGDPFSQLMEQFMEMFTSFLSGGGQNFSSPFGSNSGDLSGNGFSSPLGNGFSTSPFSMNQQSQQDSLLNQVDPKERQAVSNEDLYARDSKGYPKYLIEKGDDDKYHIYKQNKDGDGKEYTSVAPVKKGSNHLHVKDPEANKRSNGGYYSGSGGSSSAAAAASSSGGSSAAAAAASSSGGYGGGYYNGSLANQGGGDTSSPLILDTNGDGQVSATHGMGVDVNGDGKADGAATGGDKMLAMGDLNGDGNITGKEVFGDQTVDPFTGQPLNAKNGFEALQKVAQSVQQHTGVNCINQNGEVDLQKLKQALESSGKGSLGMISGNNTTQLESLGNVVSINTQNYLTQQQTGNVQHNQIGSYTDKSGAQHRVDDVWFGLR